MAGKTIYNVADCYIVACFDKDVTDEVVTTIAKMHPQYAVLRDTSMPLAFSGMFTFRQMPSGNPLSSILSSTFSIHGS